MRILTEASGSPTAAWLLRAIRDAGHLPVGSDIVEDTAAACLADDFIRMPPADAPDLWPRTFELLERHRVDLVLPSLDETLEGWSLHRDHLRRRGIHVVVSPPETLRVCLDKWATHRFFRACGVPTVATSLRQEHPLVKPRRGRGSRGVFRPDGPVDMRGRISQEIARGFEATVDALFDGEGRPVYIVPRRRSRVSDGKSTAGETFHHPGIERHVRRMAERLRFVGPVNFQCFVDGDAPCFIEINPRIAGGMALGMAATENWIAPLAEHFTRGTPFSPRPVRAGVRMVRYYSECFFGPDAETRK